MFYKIYFVALDPPWSRDLRMEHGVQQRLHASTPNGVSGFAILLSNNWSCCKGNLSFNVLSSLLNHIFKSLRWSSWTRAKLEFGLRSPVGLRLLKTSSVPANVVRKKRAQDRLNIYYLLKIIQSRPCNAPRPAGREYSCICTSNL